MILVKYAARRLLMLIPVVFALTGLAFILIRLGNANPAAMVAGPTATKEEIARITQQLGLDKPVFEQYLTYVQRLLRGDLGTSFTTGRPVIEDIRSRLPATLELIIYGMVIAILLGIGLGVWSALKRNKLSDQFLRIITLVGLSVPIFWLALLFIALFYATLNIAPPPFARIDRYVALPPDITGFLAVDSLISGSWAALGSSLAYLALPVLTVAIISGTEIAKQVRAQLIETLEGPTVRYAKASGFRTAKTTSIALRNALPSMTSYFALTFCLALGGSALVELVFSWPGLGKWGIDAIVRADFAAVQGYVLVIGIITSLVYLAGDILLAFLDPRVRLG